MSSKFRLAFLFLFFSEACLFAGENLLAIYHTSDIHGWIKPRKADPQNNLPETGGLASLKTLINQENNPYLLLDSGDWMRGAPEGNITKGDAVIDLMNVMKYDAIAIGNHEFDYGVQNLSRVLRLAKIPILAANLYKGKKRVGWAKPYIIIKKSFPDGKKVRIGLFALTTALLPQLAAPRERGEVIVKGEVESAREIVAELKKKKVDFIIALTHIGLEGEPADPPIVEGDRFLAENVPQIDLILGGHTHTITREPIIVNHSNGRKTSILHPGDRLKGVTKILLRQEGREIKFSSNSFIVLDKEIYPENDGIRKRVQYHRDLVDKKLKEIVGSLPYALEKSSAPSPVGEWMTERVRRWAKADAALISADHIKTGLPAGRITFGDIYFALPLHYRVVTVSVKGADLMDLISQKNAQGLSVFEYAGIEPKDADVGREYLLALPSFTAYLDRTLPKRSWRVIHDSKTPILDILLKGTDSAESVP